MIILVSVLKKHCSVDKERLLGQKDVLDSKGISIRSNNFVISDSPYKTGAQLCLLHSTVSLSIVWSYGISETLRGGGFAVFSWEKLDAFSLFKRRPEMYVSVQQFSDEKEELLVSVRILNLSLFFAITQRASFIALFAHTTSRIK